MLYHDITSLIMGMNNRDELELHEQKSCKYKILQAYTQLHSNRKEGYAAKTCGAKLLKRNDWFLPLWKKKHPSWTATS